MEKENEIVVVAELKGTEPKQKKLQISDLFRYATGYDYLFMFVGAIAGMGNGATLPLMTIFFGDIIQAIVTFDRNVPGAAEVLDASVRDGVLKMVLVGTGTFVLAYIQMYCWVVAGESQAKKIREAYFKSVVSQDIAWFDKNPTGELTNRLSSDMNLVQEGISDKIGLVIQFVSAFLAGFIIGYLKGWQLALVVSVCLPLLAGSAYYLSKTLAEGSEKAQTAYAGAGDVANQVLSSIRTVYAFGGEEKEKARYAKQLDIAEQLSLKNALFNGVGLGVLQFSIFCTYSLAFWYGNTLIPGMMNTGEVLNVIFAIIIGAFSIGNASPHIASVASALGAAENIFATIERKSPIDSLSESGEKPSDVVGNIEFSGINFHYPSRDDVPILKNFNLLVESGRSVALVGASGSGKSTIIKLLERFYDPVEGLITLDGKDIKTLNVTWLRQQIGMVSQEPVLFDTSIRQNIIYGLPGFQEMDQTVLDKKVEEACRQANCLEFIKNFPLGFETPCGDGGSMMSGGQKQRIAIARAIIKNPQILLLDEATSALDSESERIVQQAIDMASKGRTTITIAHRLSTIQNADKIVVMEKGVIIETGTHKSLIETGGVYAGLVLSQSLKSRTESTVAPTDSARPSATQAQVLKKVKDEVEITIEAEKEMIKSEKLDYKRLLSWSKPEFPIFAIAGFGALLNGAAQPLFAVIFSAVLPALGTDRANFYALLFLILAFVAFSANFLQGLFKYAGEKAVRRLRYASFEAILRQEVGFFDLPENSTGALMNSLAEDASLTPGLTGQTFGAAVQAIGGVGAGLVIALVAAWQLALVVLAMVPIIGFAGYMQFQTLVGFGSQTKKAYESVSQNASETISEIRTIKTITQETHFIKAFNSAILIPHSVTINGAFVSGAGFAFGQCILHFAWGFALFYSAQLMKWGLYSSGDVLTAMFAIIFTAMAVGQVSNFAPDAAKAKTSALNIFALLDRVPTIDTSLDNGEKRENAEGYAVLDNVHFAYPSRPNQSILKGLNLEAKAGQTVALVGKSGCGKSTVMGLLERWYDPSDGTISFDRLSVSNYNLKNLRSFLAIVGQEPVLFNVSIRDNIAYGALVDQVDDMAIFDAAKMANIHDFIMSLPEKYATLVGEKGGQLSGGQKQRIAIARALIRNPKLLLLDEATSALDSESEVVVQKALDAASKGRTTLVIAHRLSTIQNADLIMVVENGVIAESGTHFGLIDQNGIYANLVADQKLDA